jgi:hypothetical protein
MKMRFVLILALFPALPSFAQRAYVYPTAVTAPRGTYQTVTAIVNGVSNKGVTWSTNHGTLVGTNPCNTPSEPCTIALYDTTAETDTLTATSNANGSVSVTSTITYTASPTPVSGHPRLLVTAAMLPALRAKAVNSNPLYMAIKTQATTAFASDNNVWSWTCKSGTGKPSSDQTGQADIDANLYAFMAMVDPSDRTYQWGCYAHDMWMYMATTVVANSVSISQDRYRWEAKQLTLTTDWLLGLGLLNPTEQQQVATFLHYIGKQYLPNPNGGIPLTTGYNSPKQYSTGLGNQRTMGNNYEEAKFLYAAALPLTFGDDPTVDPTRTNCAGGRDAVCPDLSANSLWAYWSYFTGGYLYKENAHLEDPNVTWQAYKAAYSNISTQPTCDGPWTNTTPVPCFGDGRGGGPAEGTGYGMYEYFVRYAMNILHTAGYDDPILYGPQMSLVTSSFWTLNANAELTYLTGLYGAKPQQWAFFATGDTRAYARTSADYPQLAADMTWDSYFGYNTNALLWPILNVSAGGMSNFLANLSNVNQSGNIAIDLFISLPAGDPTARPPATPRPALPLDNYIAGNQSIFARTGWTSGDTAFAEYCNNSLIDHEHQVCGRFDIFSKGDYITKGQVEFEDDYNDEMSVVANNNLGSYLNNPTVHTCSGSTGCYYTDTVVGGGQFFHGTQQGPATLNHSEVPGYVAFDVDLTGVYNANTNTNSGYMYPYVGIDKASRSLVYLRGTQQVVYYDRGSSTTKAWDKAVYLISTGPLAISGNTASWPDRSATQTAYLTSLLPAGATVSDVKLDPSRGPDQAWDWEPYSRVKIDAGAVPATQFLTVLEWGASGFSKTATTLVQSASGQGFDCAEVATSLVCFMRNWPNGFKGTTFAASGAYTIYVSDLSPNASYTITGAGAPPSATSDSAGLLTFPAAGTGNITINGNSSLSETSPHSASLVTKYRTPLGVSVVALSALLVWKADRFRTQRSVDGAE